MFMRTIDVLLALCCFVALSGLQPWIAGSGSSVGMMVEGARREELYDDEYLDEEEEEDEYEDEEEEDYGDVEDEIFYQSPSRRAEYEVDCSPFSLPPPASLLLYCARLATMPCLRWMLTCEPIYPRIQCLSIAGCGMVR